MLPEVQFNSGERITMSLSSIESDVHISNRARIEHLTVSGACVHRVLFSELLRWCCSKEKAAVVEEALFHAQRSDFDAVQLPVWFRCHQHRCIYEADLSTACCCSFSGWIRCGDLIWP